MTHLLSLFLGIFIFLFLLHLHHVIHTHMFWYIPYILYLVLYYVFLQYYLCSNTTFSRMHCLIMFVALQCRFGSCPLLVTQYRITLGLKQAQEDNSSLASGLCVETEVMSVESVITLQSKHLSLNNCIDSEPQYSVTLFE